MTDHLHPGPHPDADQLNAFIEGVLPEHERLQHLTHFAACARCRQLIFLAQEHSTEPATFAVASVVDKPATAWKRWFMPIPVFSTAFALALLVTLSVYLHRSPSTPRGIQISTLQPPPNPAPVPSLSTLEALEPAKTPHAQAKRGPNALTAPSSNAERKGDTNSPTFASSKTSDIVTATPMASSAPAPAQAVEPPARDTGVVGIAAAPQPAPQIAQNDATQQLQLNGRSVVSLKMTREAQGTSIDSSGPLRLSIEHNGIPTGSLSQITGSVVDPSGAAVPGATVLARRSIDASAVKTMTDANGKFSLAALPAGQYEMQIIAPGFTALSQQIELQPRDLALLSPVLQIGAVSQSVEVSNQSTTMELQSPIPGKRSKPPSPLPSKLKPTTSVSIGDRTLTLDSAGNLFLSRNDGKHWKTVKHQWQGTVSDIASSSPASSRQRETAAPAPPMFQLTTSAHIVWISPDGLHWRLNQAP